MMKTIYITIALLLGTVYMTNAQTAGERQRVSPEKLQTEKAYETKNTPQAEQKSPSDKQRIQPATPQKEEKIEKPNTEATRRKIEK